MNLGELARKLGGEQVGGRVSVVHNGRREWVTDIGADGPFLNALGVELTESLGAVSDVPVMDLTPVVVTPVATEAPKRGRKKVDPDDIQIEL